MADSGFRKHVPFLGEVTLWFDEAEGKVHASFLGEHTRAVRMSTRAETNVGQVLQVEMAHSRLQPLRETGIEVTIQPNQPDSAVIFTPNGSININDGSSTLNILTDMGQISADVALTYAASCLRVIEVLGYGKGKRVEHSHPMLAAADKLLINGRMTNRTQVETASAGLVTFADVLGEPAYLIRPTDLDQIEYADRYLREACDVVVYGAKPQPRLIVNIEGMEGIGVRNEAMLTARFPDIYILDLTKTSVRLYTSQDSITAKLSGKDVSALRTRGSSPIEDASYLLLSVLNASAVVQAKKSPYRLAESTVLSESDEQGSHTRSLASDADSELTQMLSSPFGLDMIKQAVLGTNPRNPFLEVTGPDRLVVNGNSMWASEDEVAQASRLLELLRKA